jgi:hypothetical protein
LSSLEIPRHGFVDVYVHERVNVNVNVDVDVHVGVDVVGFSGAAISRGCLLALSAANAARVESGSELPHSKAPFGRLSG